MKDDYEELMRAAEPLRELLHKSYNSMCEARVTTERVDIVGVERATPFEEEFIGSPRNAREKSLEALKLSAQKYGMPEDLLLDNGREYLVVRPHRRSKKVERMVQMLREAGAPESFFLRKSEEQIIRDIAEIIRTDTIARKMAKEMGPFLDDCFKRMERER